MHLRFKKVLWKGVMLLTLLNPFWLATGAEKREIIQIQSPTTEQLELLPKNLSRWHLGANLLIPRPGQGFDSITFRDHRQHPERTLMDDDDSTGVHLDRGTHHYVIDLNNFIAVGRFASHSLGAAGSITLRSSDVLQDLAPDRWTQLGRSIGFRSNDWIDLRFPLTETRYLWVQIDVSDPGEFGSFSAKGMLNLASVSMSPVHSLSEAEESRAQESAESMPFDYARLYAGAQITHVSGGDPRVANFLIDDDILTYYEFPADQSESVFVLDLGDTRQADSVNLLLESGPGNLDVYYTDRNPFGETDDTFDAENQLTYLVDPATFRPALFASTESVLSARGMQFAQSSRFHSIEVPTEFLNTLGRPISISVETGKRNVSVPLPATPFRYLVVHWRSESPLPIGLRIFDLSVIGSIPMQAPPVQIQAIPVPEITEFAALASFEEGPLERIPPVEQQLPPDRPQIILPDDPPASL